MFRLMAMLFLISAAVALEIENLNFDANFLIQLIRHQHEHQALENIVIFHPKSLDANDFECLLQRELLIPLVNMNGNKLFKLAKFVGFNSLGLLFLPRIDYFHRNVSDFGLRSRHRIPMIFVLNKTPSKQEIRTFFLWCWDLNIINVVLIYRTEDKGQEVLSFTPFPELEVINLTNKEFSHYFPDKTKNLKGYLFDVDMFNDPPLLLTSPTEGIMGICGLMFKMFVKRLNGTFHMNYVPALPDQKQSREEQVLFAPGRSNRDIAINPFMSLMDFANLTAISWPIAQTKACLIVPYRREAPKYFYILHAFNSSSMRKLLYCLIAFVCLQLILNRIYTRNKRFEFGLAIIFAVNSLLGQPHEMKFSRSLPYRMILVLLVTHGFIISNTFTASLTARFSTSVPGQQVRTVNDFLATNQKIMSNDFYNTLYFKSGLLPRRLNQRLLTVSVNTMLQHRSILNTTYAYIANSEKWSVLNFQQQTLWKPRFHIASNSMCTPKLQENWAIQFDSPFDEPLKDFLMRVYSQGFVQKFITLSNSVKKRTLFAEEQPELPQPLTMEHFAILFNIMFAYAICILVFVGEHIVWRLKRLRLHRRNRNSVLFGK